MAAKKKTSKRKSASNRKGASKRKTQGFDFERRMEEFTGEIEAFGRKFERMVEEEEEEDRALRDVRPHVPHGPIGQLVAAVISIFFLAVFLWVMDMIGFWSVSPFLVDLRQFVWENIAMFFIISIFFGYKQYLNENHPRFYVPFSPLFAGFGFMLVLWLVLEIIGLANTYVGNNDIYLVTFMLERYSYVLMWTIVFVGYISLLMTYFMESPRLEARRRSLREFRKRRWKRTGRKTKRR